MKTLPALLVAVALISPAFAQNTALQEIQKHLKGPVVSPAFKPILLHTGKPITQSDKAQLQVSAAKTYAAKAPAMKARMRTQQTAPPAPMQAIITPSQWSSQNGLVLLAATAPGWVSPSVNMLQFNSDKSSYLTIVFVVEANMTYTFTWKVNDFSSNPQFTILTGLPGDSSVSNSETFTGSDISSEFAYALVASHGGVITVSLYSPNTIWEFESCEIIGTPIN